MRSDSPTRSRLCKLACETPILDICDVERNPKYENARYTLVSLLIFAKRNYLPQTFKPEIPFVYFVQRKI